MGYKQCKKRGIIWQLEVWGGGGGHFIGRERMLEGSEICIQGV